MGTIRFGNEHFATIIGYGDYVHGNVTICHVYYIEGLGHNLFSVGQFCDGDLEVVFRSKTYYLRNLEGQDLLTGARDSNLYTIFISDMAASSPMCLMSKDTSIKSWLWHRRLSHLNFEKSKKDSLQPKLVPSTHSKLELIHMDLCGPMRVESINGKKYSLVQIQKVRSENGTKFKNATLQSHSEKLGIMQQFSIARTPQQNSVVERRNHSLVEAARTMLLFSKAS
ncbi:retrovirus-related pol polyprotein from transposon TNT 1-94 [Tanacetum coccineum]